MNWRQLVRSRPRWPASLANGDGGGPWVCDRHGALAGGIPATDRRQSGFRKDGPLFVFV